MVFIRALLPLAALATAVLAAPANIRDLSVSSGGSDCSGSSCGSDSSSCSGSDCGSSSSSSSSSMDCSGGSCDSSSSSSMDCSGGSCDQSSMTMSSSMDCSGGSCDSSSSSSMDCGSGGCGESSMTMSMDCSGGSCDQSSMTMTSSAMYSMATYGSGSSNWNQYQSCVEQCIAQFGGESSSGSSDSGSGSSSGSSDSGSDLTPTATMGSGGSNGATHTVIVAPTKGVLRMVPFATEANVGDTIEFIWGADQHTITKGSALQLCNQSQDATTFNTGLQNHSFSYLQVVNDTNPVYYYCAHPGHCQNGMFGVINPLTTNDPALMAGGAQAQNMSDSTMAAMAYTQSAMANGTSSDANNLAKTWGSSYSLKDIPTEMHGAFMENMLYARALIAMNPDLVSDGKLKMSTAGAPIMWPTDVAGASNLAAAAPQNAAAAAAPAAAAAASSSSAAAPAATTAGKKNGARGLAVSGATVALGLVVSFLAL